MKKRNSYVLCIVAILTVFSMLVFSGCGEEKSGNTISEPEITVEYLTEEYASQLETDGAETITGFVTLEKNDDSYIAHIEEQEVVPNSDYKEGYYIADTNMAVDASLGDDVRITCLLDDELSVVTADEFIQQEQDDSQQLYTIYLMGDSAELILSVDPKSLISE